MNPTFILALTLTVVCVATHLSSKVLCQDIDQQQHQHQQQQHLAKRASMLRVGKRKFLPAAGGPHTRHLSGVNNHLLGSIMRYNTPYDNLRLSQEDTLNNRHQNEQLEEEFQRETDQEEENMAKRAELVRLLRLMLVKLDSTHQFE